MYLVQFMIYKNSASMAKTYRYVLKYKYTVFKVRTFKIVLLDKNIFPILDGDAIIMFLFCVNLRHRIFLNNL